MTDTSDALCLDTDYRNEMLHAAEGNLGRYSRQIYVTDMIVFRDHCLDVVDEGAALWDEEAALMDEIKEFEAAMTWQGGIDGLAAHDDWLISEDYFTTYTQDYAAGAGLVEDTEAWPCTYIDWDKAAEDLKSDYCEYEWRGQTFLGEGLMPKYQVSIPEVHFIHMDVQADSVEEAKEKAQEMAYEDSGWDFDSTMTFGHTMGMEHWEVFGPRER